MHGKKLTVIPKNGNLIGERCSVVVKVLCYKPEGRVLRPDEVNE
jgi:hypothetical protein